MIQPSSPPSGLRPGLGVTAVNRTPPDPPIALDVTTTGEPPAAACGADDGVEGVLLAHVGTAFVRHRVRVCEMTPIGGVLRLVHGATVDGDAENLALIVSIDPYHGAAFGHGGHDAIVLVRLLGEVEGGQGFRFGLQARAPEAASAIADEISRVAASASTAAA